MTFFLETFILENSNQNMSQKTATVYILTGNFIRQKHFLRYSVPKLHELISMKIIIMNIKISLDFSILIIPFYNSINSTCFIF